MFRAEKGSPRASNTPMPTALSIRDASCPHSFWRMALRSVRFWRFGGILKRSIRRRLFWDQRRKTRRSSPCGNGAPSLRALPPSWKGFATERLKGRAIAGPHDYDQIPALIERSKLRVKNFYADLDTRLAEVPFCRRQHRLGGRHYRTGHCRFCDQSHEFFGAK